MKLEASSRLRATTKLECGCLAASCVHAKLTKKQEQLDVNGDGKITSDDLKRLRKGEKPIAAATKLAAYALPLKDRIAMLKSLYKDGKLGKLGMKFDTETATLITHDIDPNTPEKLEAIMNALKKLGYTVPWKNRRANASGLSKAGGKEPIELDLGKMKDILTIKIHQMTSPDPKDYKEAEAEYLKTAKHVFLVLDQVPGPKPTKYDLGVYFNISPKSKPIGQTEATRLLEKAGYGKGNKEGTSVDFGKSPVSKIPQYVELRFDVGGKLYRVTCAAIP